MRSLLSGLALAAALASPILAASPALAEQRPVVVELFTSQGCSSCPPADAFLSDLARTRADVLPLAFHVTYWDSLGWRDPYDMKLATERQRHYGALLNLDTIYTPQMVVDGATDVVGSDRQSGLLAIQQARSAASAGVPVMVRREGQGLVVSLGAGSGMATIFLVGYDPQHRTEVGRGENQGRTLLESNIVRAWVAAGSWNGQRQELHAAVPDGERTAVVLQAADGRILGAARLTDG